MVLEQRQVWQSYEQKLSHLDPPCTVPEDQLAAPFLAVTGKSENSIPGKLLLESKVVQPV